MNSDIEVKESLINGLGVFAVRDFEKGGRVVEWNQIPLSQVQYDALPEDEKNKYVSKKDGVYLLSGKPMRYVNHSCDPNTLPKDGADVAIRTIKKGEEITSSYQDVGMVCNCGAKNCATAK